MAGTHGTDRTSADRRSPDRKRRQGGSKSATRALSQARKSSRGRMPTIIGVIAVVVLAVVVIAGVLVSRSGGGSPASSAAIPVVHVNATYPVSLQNGVVTAGKAGAPATIDAYEDFLCPVCGAFEAAYGAQIQSALNSGQLDVRYHMVNLLDANSNPNGYSLEAANAGLCAADAGIFPDYHASLYGKQPPEGGAGYTANQLVALGQQLGAKGNFSSCVQSGAHDAEAQAQLDHAADIPALQAKGANGNVLHTADGKTAFRGTPSILDNGHLINYQDPNWLQKTIAGNPPLA